MAKKEKVEVVKKMQEEIVEEIKEEVVEEIQEDVAKQEDCIVRVNIFKLNVREAPHIGATVKYIAKQDEKLQVAEDVENEEWVKVRNVAGIEGFAMKQYLVMNE